MEIGYFKSFKGPVWNIIAIIGFILIIGSWFHSCITVDKRSLLEKQKDEVETKLYDALSDSARRCSFPFPRPFSTSKEDIKIKRNSIQVTMWLDYEPSNYDEIEKLTSTELRRVARTLKSMNLDPIDNHISIFVWAQKRRVSGIQLYGKSSFDYHSGEIEFKPWK